MTLILALACLATPDPGADSPDIDARLVCRELTRDEDDDPRDEAVDRHYSFSYDSGGRSTMNEADGSVGAADGVVDERWNYTYNDAGTELLIDNDEGADGTVDNREMQHFDDAGNNTGIDHDYGADGILDSRFTRSFDDEGHQLTGSYDSDGDGTPNVLVTYDWDSEWNNVAMNYDGDADGAFLSPWDTIVSYTWDDGRMTTGHWWFPDRSGYTYEYQYDDAGTLLSSDERLDDGSLVQLARYGYADGDLTTVETDDDADGSINSRDTYAYDTDHNKVLDEDDQDADGVADSRETWTWSCTSGA